MIDLKTFAVLMALMLTVLIVAVITDSSLTWRDRVMIIALCAAATAILAIAAAKSSI